MICTRKNHIFSSLFDCVSEINGMAGAITTAVVVADVLLGSGVDDDAVAIGNLCRTLNNELFLENQR